MAWKKGQSGNPAGPKIDKPWRDALALALSERDWSSLRAIADVVVQRALDGDMLAVKEIGDRLDGKAKQQTEMTGSEGGPLIVQVIRFAGDPTPK